MVTALDTAHESVAKDVRHALSEQAEPFNQRRIVRVESHFPATDLVAWLNAQTDTERFYWSDRDGLFATAGIGIAAEHYCAGSPSIADAMDAMRRDLAGRYPNLRYYGGFRFDLGKPRAERWKPFGGSRFVVPRFEIGRLGSSHYFACNVLVEAGESPADKIDDMLDFVESVTLNSPEFKRSVPSVLSRDDLPDRDGWTAMFNAAHGRFENGLDKVVLARESQFQLPDRIAPAVLLDGLIHHTTFSFRFAFEFEPGTAFVGASPERLYKRTADVLVSEALAGTRPRVSDPERTEELGRELLRSDKERREHNLVLQHLRAVFEKHCRAVRGGDKTELLILRHCQHLITRIEGMLDNKVTDTMLLESFHPTPALGGSPVDAALDTIAHLEPFERGWYGGPVGWVSHNASEFAVAIRSGLVHRDRLSVYSGAGIVPDSEAEAEWSEIENKMSNFLHVLGAGGSNGAH